MKRGYGMVVWVVQTGTINKHAKYVLSAEDEMDCQRWVTALEQAAVHPGQSTSDSNPNPNPSCRESAPRPRMDAAAPPCRLLLLTCALLLTSSLSDLKAR